MKKWPLVALLVLGATFLGATVLSGPIASAAQSVSATITGPLDGQGNVKVHEQGTANVNVLGNASVQAAIPASQFSLENGTNGPPIDLSGPDPAGTNYAITSVSFSNRDDTPGTAELFGAYGETSDCISFTLLDTSFGPLVAVPAHDTVTLTFPQPFVIKAKSGAASCLSAVGHFGLTDLSITVVGYRF
jgi:hypothetical protein